MKEQNPKEKPTKYRIILDSSPATPEEEKENQKILKELAKREER